MSLELGLAAMAVATAFDDLSAICAGRARAPLTPERVSRSSGEGDIQRHGRACPGHPDS